MSSLHTVTLQSAIDLVPPGGWAVGVSGGADSVALLSLLRRRRDLQLTVVHLDHETRAGASRSDAAFVGELCSAWSLPCVASTLSAIEPRLRQVVKNQSARWRLARLALYRQVTQSHHLSGVVLGHHADDQAETVFFRLLRSGRPAGVTGMADQQVLGGMTVLRPLLRVRRQALRDHLRAIGQPWREDESNTSARYTRSRIRRLLSARPELVEPLIDLGEQCRRVSDWIRHSAPALPERFHVDDVRRLPAPVARAALLLWLRRQGSQDADSAAAERLLEMAHDAATTPRQHFPGRLLVCRRRGEIFAAPQ